jgi:adenylate cyclase
VVLNALAQSDPEQVLEPREADVSVLFCDLRGFSRRSEEAAENLLELLKRVSVALGVTTSQVLRMGGVVGDFHGDAAMGFWGWPIGDPHTSVSNACLAALAIRAEFETASRQLDHPLQDFRVGIGIASGKAVAGRIGTTDQVKVTVFGPVVNLASRLEGLTKYVHAPIVIDETTAKLAQQRLGDKQLRTRRLAHVLPVGLTQPVWIYELLPPEGVDSPLSNRDLEVFEQAVVAFQAGKWHEAFKLLHQVPADDEVKDFLTVYIASHSRVAPADWNGVIRMQSK